MVRELSGVGVRVELPSNQPLVLLKESDGERYLPIWIGPQEATAIAHAQQGVVTARPMTHDLLRNVLQALQAPVDRVVITELQEGTFLSNLVFVSGLEVSSRPSDAIALALRMGVPVFAEDSVLDSAGVAVPDEQESEVEKFREFLDTISPDDFNIGS
jgi:bifunctional DNase/RNase